MTGKKDRTDEFRKKTDRQIVEENQSRIPVTRKGNTPLYTGPLPSKTPGKPAP